MVTIRSRAGRRRLFTAAVPIAAVLAGCSSSGASEATAAAEGYREVGTVDQVRFWVDPDKTGDIGLRTTGKLGGICNHRGPFNDPRMDVCGGAVPNVGSVFAYVVADTVHGVSLLDSTGETLTATGYLPLTSTVPGKQLAVIIVPKRVVFAAGVLQVK